MRSKVITALLLSSLVISFAAPLATASSKAGAICKTKGQTSIVFGKKFTCVKSGKKLVWNKGILIKKTSAASPSPTASPSPSMVPCPTPLLQTPVDLSKVTSILYPGQERGGDYKAHGGFGFDNATNNLVTVRIPLDGKIMRVVRYKEIGEVQYLFEFDGNCGVSFRFDHLRKLTPKFEAIVNVFPLKEDTRTDPVDPPVSVTTGEIIATEVGFLNNVSVDFGVYDMRQKNETSKDPSWASAHSRFPTDSYGICWFDFLPKLDSDFVKSLPSRDANNGKKSDYCK